MVIMRFLSPNLALSVKLNWHVFILLCTVQINYNVTTLFYVYIIIMNPTTSLSFLVHFIIIISQLVDLNMSTKNTFHKRDWTTN